MSYVPKGLMPAVVPTFTGPCPAKLLSGTMYETAQVPAAWFHWYTVGSCLPENSAKAAASYQLTPETGKSACPSGKSPSIHVAGPGRPVVSRNCAMASFHERACPFCSKGNFQNSGLE